MSVIVPTPRKLCRISASHCLALSCTHWSIALSSFLHVEICNCVIFSKFPAPLENNCLRHVPAVAKDRIVLYTELDDHCDKLQRSSVGARMYFQLFDRRRYSLSRSERPTFSSWVDKTLRRSVCRAEVRSLRKSPRGKYPYFSRYLIFLITQCGICRKKPPCQKTSSIRPTVLIEQRLVIDTDGQTQTQLGL